MNRCATYLSSSEVNAESGHGLRILVVDDDDINRGLNEAVLSMEGFGTESAADGAEALVYLATGDFDLLLTDCQMPNLDGIGLIRRLRASGSRIPIVMVSGSLNHSALPEDVASEVAAALPKPARADEILAAVRHALGDRAPSRARITDVFPRTRRSV